VVTSLHRLIAIVVVWAAFAFAFVILLGNAFVNDLSVAAVVTITALVAGAAFGATAFVARADGSQ
jgi:hypothetical protein